MNIRPTKDRVMVLPKSAEQKTVGGIYIPESAQEKTQEGEVMAVWDDKDCPLKVGDKVVFEAFSGNEIKVGEKKHLIMNIKDILAVLG